MSFLDRIAECNRHDLSRFLPFRVGGTRIGWIARHRLPLLARFREAFVIAEDAVALAPALGGYAARSRAVAAVVGALEADGAIAGRRDELYPVTLGYGAPPLFEIERAAVPFFGLRAFGVHVNGYVRDGEEISMWIGRRAFDKPTYPGELDNLVAGGQPIGLGLMANVVKEAEEEAGIPPALARRARPVGAVSYVMEAPEGLKPDVMFAFDLELPRDFTPVNRDGELAEFHLWPVGKVMAITAETGEFKFNCNLINIDFFIRHGLIPPEHPDYLEIIRGLRQ